MKKVVLAAFLACAVATCLPLASAQDASSGAQPAAAANPCAAPQMAAPEYAVYNNAMTQTDPKAKAAAFEQYLTQYPQSAVKETVLEALISLYSGFDASKTLDAADRLLKVNPENITGLYAEALIRENQANSITDATAKQAAMDTAADYAQKGLAAPKPKCMSQADFDKLKTNFDPTFYSVIGNDAFNKKDTATAIANFKKELASVPLEQTKVPGQVLQDTFYLAEAYEQSTPPDYLDCAFYASRAVDFAPDNFKAIMSPTAKYCYHKYHGTTDDQWDQLTQLASANLNPPADLGTTIKPAPTPADIVNQVIATTPDLSTLATSDKEYILQNGTPDQQAKVWDTMKGKSFQFPNILVIASTPQQVQAAVSEDAVQSKTADFTFNMTPPPAVPDLPAHPTAAEKLRHEREVKKAADDAAAIAAATAPGQTVTLSGTFDSYTQKPFMINLTDGAVVLPTPTKPAAKPAAHTATHATTHKAATH